MYLVFFVIGISPIWIFVIYVVRRKTNKIQHRKLSRVHSHYFKKEITESQRLILITEFEFYNRLKEEYRPSFEHQLAHFIKKKKFAGKEGLVVTEEMKVLIGASYVMLTFGMPHYNNTSIKTIEIHPKKYYSKYSKGYHYGEYNPRQKTIKFSWEDFLKGYEFTNDNRNLGIHEFTHALHVHAYRKNEASSENFIETFNQIIEYSHRPSTLRSIKNAGYFRDYAFTNRMEFLAVLLEHFYETPKEFKRYFPRLFEMIVHLLNYDERVFKKEY